MDDCFAARTRWIGIVVLAVVAGILPGGLAADGESPAIPRDTLPPDLARRRAPAGLGRPESKQEVDQATVDRVKLGRRLFFDPILSGDRSLACVSCHDPAHGFSDPRPVSIGINKARGRRNAPSLFNVALGRSFFWDGRVASLEDQVRFPIENPRELGSKLETVVARLEADADYSREFGRLFTDGVTVKNLSRSIADFERTLLLGNSRTHSV